MTPRATQLALFGDQSESLGNYLQLQMERFQTAGSGLGSRVYGALQNSYNYVTDTLQKYRLRDELVKHGIGELDNHFATLETFEDFQRANLTMQRWIMAHPEVRKLYLNQDCDGYSDSYRNIAEVTGVGEDDYDYRRATNGWVFPTEDGGYEYTIYHEDLIIGDRELDHWEQMRVMETLDNITNYMKECNHDFTADTPEPIDFNR